MNILEEKMKKSIINRQGFHDIRELIILSLWKTALDISRELNINRSTVHRILNILMENKVVYQSPNSRKYAIGARAFQIGLHFIQPNPHGANKVHIRGIGQGNKAINWLCDFSRG